MLKTISLTEIFHAFRLHYNEAKYEGYSYIDNLNNKYHRDSIIFPYCNILHIGKTSIEKNLKGITIYDIFSSALINNPSLQHRDTSVVFIGRLADNVVELIIE